MECTGERNDASVSMSNPLDDDELYCYNDAVTRFCGHYLSCEEDTEGGYKPEYDEEEFRDFPGVTEDCSACICGLDVNQECENETECPYVFCEEFSDPRIASQEDCYEGLPEDE
ncbi:MAG: hypothetical protein M1831_006310, partial [Alyxoria varia]